MLIATAGAALIIWMGVSFWNATRVDVEVRGLVDGTPFTPDAAALLDISITVPSDDDRFRAAVTLDGVDLLDDVEFLGDTLRLRPAELVASEVVQNALDEGEHEIVLSVGRLFLSDSVFRWRYVVDSQAPLLEVPVALDPVPIDEPVSVTGRIEPEAALLLDGEEVPTEDGTFEVRFERPPTRALRFEAVDRAGNRTAATSAVPVIYPESSRGVHVTASGWANAELRAGVLDLVDRGLVDTVELDIKDESGIVGHSSEVATARRIGAVQAQFDLRDAVRTIESHGARVVGRLVAFRDPVYARAAWDAGRTDEVLQAPDGGMLALYGGYANYVHPAVRQYNLELAVEAAELGVGDILWDYIRRPEGAPDTMVVPGLDRPSSEVVADFLADSHDQLRSMGVYQGASVFGIAAAAGDAIAQDVPLMADSVDYLAPMIYPSHWGPGQYGVERPIREPYEITRRSLAHFQAVTAGTGVRFLPWIQDFSLYGVAYGPAEVRAQIDAARDLGITGFFLWNPNVRYTAEALTP